MNKKNIYKKIHKFKDFYFNEIISPLSIKNTVSIQYNVGSIHDTKGREGIAHLLEHLVLHARDKNKTYVEREKLGMYVNATTYKDVTIYTASSYILSVDELLLRLLSMMNFNFNKQDLTEEVETIISEIAGDKEDNDSIIYDKVILESLKDSKSHGEYIHSALGYTKSLKNISIDDLKGFLHKNYVNPIISTTSAKVLSKKQLLNISNNIDTKKIIYLHKDKGNTVPKNKLKINKFDLNHKTTSIHCLYIKNTSKKDHYIYLLLLRFYLGGNWSSVCNKKMRIDNQYTYYVSSFINMYSDFSLIYITYDVVKSKEKDAKDVCNTILDLTLKGSIDKDIFIATRNMLLSYLYNDMRNEEYLLENFMWLNDDCGGEVIDIEDNIRFLENVTIGDFKKFLKEVGHKIK